MRVYVIGHSAHNERHPVQSFRLSEMIDSLQSKAMGHLLYEQCSYHLFHTAYYEYTAYYDQTTYGDHGRHDDKDRPL